MAGHNWPNTLFLLWLVITSASAKKCDRMIDGTKMLNSPVGTRFRLVVMNSNRSDYVGSYIPNTRYVVILEGNTSQSVSVKFTRFLLSAESLNETLESGAFDLENQSLAKFSDKCPNAVVETSMIPKKEVSIVWTSPPEGNDCVYLRATVMEAPNAWYIDEEPLVVKMCQDSKVEADDQGPVLQECCACDEAKYEVTFEGLWSRNTHPKDFPSKGWTIRFSDVIGASHTVDYRFWKYYGEASEGLRQVAEIGSTRKLESELKDQSDHIRTIIKARGISYPNVTGKTFAVFRVDRKHHLMSLVSMINPSPDWIVGVSGLELCLVNCSWIEHKELNLYPYDAGTDDGITYMSPDSPSEPQQLIRRITSSFPNDTRSPFYDPSGADMKPIAKLYLNRQRLYEKTCDDVSTVTGESDQGCKVTSWGHWSACSSTCGKGSRLRQRKFHDEADEVSSKCNVKLTDRRSCRDNPPCSINGPYDTGILGTSKCILDEWSEWSSCSATCGRGVQTRSRNFSLKRYRKQCRAEPNAPELQQNMDCDNEPCIDKDFEEVRETDDTADGSEDNGDEDEDAGENYEDEDDNANNEEEDNDNQDNEEQNEKIDRAAELIMDAKYENTEEWQQKCPNSRYTDWALWSPCSVSCGTGFKLRSRTPISSYNRWNGNYEQDDKYEDLEECKNQETTCTAFIYSCDFTKEEAEQFCNEPVKEGHCTGHTLSYYFDKQSGICKTFYYTGCEGNRNNFPTVEDCNRTCINDQRELRANLSAIMKNFKVSVSSVLSYHIPVQEQRSIKTKRAKSGSEWTTENLLHNGIEISSQIIDTTETNDGRKVDCRVTDWSEWRECRSCRGYRSRRRKILVKSQNGGKRCPRKLKEQHKCRKLCDEGGLPDVVKRRSYRDHNSAAEYQEESVDCVMEPWSSWSRCAATCGDSEQHRSRNIKVLPRGPYGELCPHVVEVRKCNLPPCHYYQSVNYTHYIT